MRLLERPLFKKRHEPALDICHREVARRQKQKTERALTPPLSRRAREQDEDNPGLPAFAGRVSRMTEHRQE